jgi:hypothetical protein
LTATAEQSAPVEPPAKPEATSDSAPSKAGKKKKHWFRRLFGIPFVLIVLALIGARLAAPTVVRWYVNRTIDQSPLYDGQIGDIDIHLWRGAYTINDIRLNKVTGNVPVPLFAARRLDLAMQWNALLAGEIVGKVRIDQPELNFVDGDDSSQDQTGVGGPWLEILEDLFPFRINQANVINGSIHFRAFDKNPPVDVFIDQLDAQLDNLTNIHNDTTPLIATVTAKGKAMGHADLQYQMKLDPFSYNPTFQMAVRLIGLDVTKVNNLTRAYGAFDFEKGFFDLVVEVDSKEGGFEGYVKPMFRNIKVLSLKDDVKEDDVFRVFWEALVGVAAEVLQNQPRDQFATRIPMSGDLTSPRTDILASIGNILRNAFIRAYLPRLQGTAEDIDLQFGPGSVADPIAPGDL